MSRLPKYDIIGKGEAHSDQGFPKFFFDDDLEKAEALYKDFEKTLDILSYNYSTFTGMSKGDLFGESLFGLAKAKRDFDPNRSDNFKTFAVFVIKTVLNEYVRKYSAQITIPSYLKKSSRHLSILKGLLGVKYATAELIKFRVADKNLDSDTKKRVDHLIKLLSNAATRARVSIGSYIERLELLPAYVEETLTEMASQSYDRMEEQLQASLLVEKLKGLMTNEEREISEMIMTDMSYEEIGNRFGNSGTWVGNKVRNMEEKFRKLNIDV